VVYNNEVLCFTDTLCPLYVPGEPCFKSSCAQTQTERLPPSGTLPVSNGGVREGDEANSTLAPLPSSDMLHFQPHVNYFSHYVAITKVKEQESSISHIPVNQSNSILSFDSMLFLNHDHQRIPQILATFIDNILIIRYIDKALIITFILNQLVIR
jgi:hypothetical protein